MYQQQKKTPFCALTMYLRSTGNQSPKYEYKADAKSLFTCSLTKKKYKLSQIDEWYHTEGVQNFVRQGYSGKWFAKTQEIENPNKYDKSNLQMILSFIMRDIEVNGLQRHKKLKILTNMIKVICK